PPVCPHARREDAVDRAEGDQPERRQPAEGRAREVGGARAACADRRRADARYRYRCESGSACAAWAARRAGDRDYRDLVGFAGSARDQRPDSRRARRAIERRVRARAGVAGTRDGGGYRIARERLASRKQIFKRRRNKMTTIVVVHTGPVTVQPLKDQFKDQLPDARVINIVDDSP